MTRKIFMIAGEPSGDVLGASLIAALNKASTQPLEFVGVGGEKMEAEGFESMMPMGEICVMGIWEVLGQLPRLMKLGFATVQEIEKQQPDIVVTIDLPDFNFGVGAKLKKRGIYKGKIVHYVAPTVWAWRPKRAEKISKFLDGLMCLFPFEPKYFPKIKTASVGHPLAENQVTGSAKAIRERYQIPENAKILGLFYGSRASEISNHQELIQKVANALHEQYPDLHVIIPTLPSLEYEMYKATEELRMPKFVVTDIHQKENVIAACDAALAVSGTIGLELALHGVPHVITYKMSPVSWMILKLLVKSKYAHLANILLDAPIVPEFLQSKANPYDITRALMKIYQIDTEREKQTSQTEKLRTMLSGQNNKTASEEAADFVLSFLN